MGNPFEWLRAMARRAGDDDGDELVVEASDALGSLDADPAGLVVAARRLLAHHRHHGGLWWLVSHMLCAPEPAAAARRCSAMVRSDRTVARLAGALPIQGDGGRLVVAGWSDTVAAALEERPDLDVVCVVDPTDRRRARSAAARAELRDASQLAGLAASVALVPAHAVGPRRAVVDAVAGAVITATPRADVWLVAPLWRLLPARLADAVHSAVGDERACASLEIARVDRIAGPRGVEAPSAASASVDCPVAAELLRPFDA